MPIRCATALYPFQFQIATDGIDRREISFKNFTVNRKSSAKTKSPITNFFLDEIYKVVKFVAVLNLFSKVSCV